MAFFIKNIHKKLIFLIILFILNACKLQEPYKTHGIINLANRSETLKINKSNINDVIKIIGQPHTVSIENDNEWIYFERVLTKGDFHKLGQNVLKTNNVLLLKFNKYGILENKQLVGKDSKNKVAFSENVTENKLSQKSFVQKFLSSLKNKMYGKR